MNLDFLGDAGVYLPGDDGIKLTAFSDGNLREFIVTRAALIAAGANPTTDPAGLLAFFEQNREVFNVAAANTLPQLSVRCFIRAEDIARGRLASFVAKPHGLKADRDPRP